MKTVPFGSATVPEMMRTTEKNDAQIRELYGTARAAAIEFFDHADI